MALRLNAQVSASDTGGCAPFTGIQFSNSYAGATGINWDFDDGASSNLPNPQHSFINPGTYNVVFTATVAGNAVNDDITIQVYDLPDASFTVTSADHGCTGLMVSFDDTSVGGGNSAIASWSWSFGDGGVNNSSSAPSYQFNLPGLFDVGVIVTDVNGCVGSVTIQDVIAISEEPEVTITTDPSPPAVCDPPLNVTFNSTATSNSPLGNALTYAWDFDNGTTSTQADPPAVNYTLIGLYQVQLTVTDDNDCSVVETVSVSIAQPQAIFTALGGENDTVCKVVSFINNSTGISPLYTYGDGLSGTQSTHTYNSPGWYDVTLEVESGPCADDTTISIYVQFPTVTISTDIDTICEFPGIYNLSATSNSSIGTYDWQLPYFEFSSSATVTDTVFYETTEYSINEANDVTITLNITTTDGCTANDTEEFVLVRPNALFYPDEDEGCAPLQVTFTDYSTSEYPTLEEWEWHFGDGSPVVTNTSGANVIHTYSQEGTYNPYLIVTTSAGCRDTSWLQTIDVGVLPVPSFTIDPNSVCVGEEIQITNTTALADSVDTWNYSGDDNLLFSCQTVANPTVTFTSETGTATITMSAGYNGCFATTTQEIEVNGPVAKLLHSCNCETPYDYPFTADVSDATNWDWDFGDGTVIQNSTVSAINHHYETSGDYTVTLIARNSTNGCSPDTAIVPIHVRAVEAIINLPDSLCAGQPIDFSAAGSIDAAESDGVCYPSFVWYFGDNTRPKMTHDSYSHAYNTGGHHTVELWAEDINGCVDSSSFDIFVSSLNIAISYVQDGPCLPMTVDFNSTVTSDLPIINYSWYFGDGNISGEEDPTNIYLEELLGANNQIVPYEISFTATNSLGCSAAEDASITPNVPNANFVATSEDQICAGGTVSFDPILAEAGNQFSWDFGDGGTSTAYNPNQPFLTPGIYDVTLTVTNALGCSNTQVNIQAVDVQAFPVANFISSIPEGETICYPAQITFTDISEVNPFGSRIWDLGNGTPAIGTPSIGANYDAPGEYTITLIEITTAGCADTTQLTIEVEGPVGDFLLTPTSICRGDEILLNVTDTVDVMTWQWDFGDGNVAGPLWQTSHEYDFEFNPVSGQTVVSLVLWNQDSVCSIVVQKQLDFVNVVADFFRNDETTAQDSIHCEGIQDIFTDNSSLNVDIWHWDFGNGQTFNGESPLAVNYAPGTYEITLSVLAQPEGCVDTVSKTVVIYPLPNATAMGGVICLGENFQLSASGGESYVWTPGETLNDSLIQTPTAFPDISTIYNVLVTDTNGCENNASATVGVIQPLQPVDLTTTLIIGETFNPSLPTDGAYTYEWTPDLWISCIDCGNPVIQPLQDTVYYVTISDTLGCFEIQSRYEFVVLQLASVDVPDAFTPNGDHTNEIVYVKGWGIERLLEFKIFNRWGELVFETTNINEGWDGSYKGEQQMADTYSYIVSVKPFIQDTPLTQNGFINLIR